MNERYCVKEEYWEVPASGCVGCYISKQWTFTYSDGTVEHVTVRVRK